MSKKQLLRVVALLCLALPMLPAQWLGDMEPAYPGGDYVLIGQQLQLECHVEQHTGFNASNLFIEKGDVFNGTLTLIDSWTVRTNDAVHSLNYSGNYFCWVDNNSLVGSVRVEVDYPPKPPVNLSCVMFNWDEELTCTWELGVEYVDPNNMNVIFHYLPNGETIPAICPNQTKTSCQWEYFYYRGISIILEVNNTKANVSKRSELFKFTMDDIVKPEKVTVEDLLTTPDTITVVWSHRRKFRSKVYRLKFRKRHAENWTEHIISSQLGPGDEESADFNHTFTNLHPYTEYELELDTRPTLTTGYWSDPVTRYVRTNQDVPSTGPRVNQGSYYQDQCGQGYNRDVTVYWQEPDQQAQNGVISGYELHSNGINVTLDVDTYHYTFPSVSCESDSVVQLFARTPAGPSYNYSQIIVPTQSTGDNMVDYFIVVVSETEVQAKWNVLDYKGEITQIYLSWCKGSKVLSSCEDKLQWMHVSPDQTAVDLPVSVSQIDNLLFAISVSVNASNAGLQWATCVVKKVAPSQPPEGLQVEKTNERTSLKVKWRNTRCQSSDPALITQYRLYVAEIHDGKEVDQRSYLYNISTDEHDEHNLHVNGNYSFQLQAASQYGQSPLSAAVFVTISDNTALTDKMLLIPLVLVAVTLVLLAIIVVYCKRDTLKKMLKSKYEIDLPQWKSPVSSPSREPLTDTNTSASSSLEDNTAKTAQTESYTINSSSGGTSLKSVPSEISETAAHPMTPVITQEADLIQVVIMKPKDSSADQTLSHYPQISDDRPAGVQHPDYARAANITPDGTLVLIPDAELLQHVQGSRVSPSTAEVKANDDYSLFTNRPVELQHPDYTRQTTPGATLDTGNKPEDDEVKEQTQPQACTRLRQDLTVLKSSEVMHPDYALLPLFDMSSQACENENQIYKDAAASDTADITAVANSCPKPENSLVLVPGGYVPTNIFASGKIDDPQKGLMSEPKSRSDLQSAPRSRVESGSGSSGDSLPSYVKAGTEAPKDIEKPAILNVPNNISTTRL